MVMTMKLLLTIFIFIFVANAQFQAYAEDKKGMYPHAGFCEGISSTAAALKCVSRHKVTAEENLRKVSDALVKNRDEETRKQFIDTQNAWLAYRNEECSWEKSLVESDVAQRLYEASCLASLTENRANQLSYALKSSSGESAVPEFSYTSQWMNRVFNNYPDVYWTTKKRVSIDLDCDGRNEEIMTGIVPDYDSQTKSYNLSAHIAVATNPVIGQPQITDFILPVAPDGQAESTDGVVLCSRNFSLSGVEKTYNNENIDVKDAQTCGKIVKIRSGNNNISCDDLEISKDENGFVMTRSSEGEI